MTEKRAHLKAAMMPVNLFAMALVLAVFWAKQPLGNAAELRDPNGGPADVGAVLESSRQDGDIPGIVALVLRGDRIVGRGAAGVRKQGDATRMSFDDQLHLGSCTKAMTATLVAMLIDEGKLRWSTTLGELFADGVKHMHPRWKTVTLRQLLTHRAGLPRGNDPGVGLDPDLVVPTKSAREMRQILVESQLSREPETPPGTRETYSNVDYIIVGAALEKITGRAWEDLMQQRIFKPLGITTGGFGAPGSAGRVDQPWGHDRVGKPVEPGSSRSDLPTYAGPCGTVHMTMSDWAKFIALHLRGDPANPNRQVALLSPSDFEQLHRANPGDSYAPGGWVVGTFEPAKGTRLDDKGLIFGHEGSNGFWYSKVLVAPEIDLAVLVVCNRGGASIGGESVAGAAVELLRRFALNPRTSK